MSLMSTMLLGFIAGVTILFGLPIGRLRRPAPSLRALLNATAIGVLLFLVWDVFSLAWVPIDEALASVHAGKGGLGAAAGYGVLFAGGLAVGLLSLVYYESWMVRRIPRPQTSVAALGGFGPGAMDVGELQARQPSRIASWSDARRLSLLIAVGIGLHNFAEGLAIGQSSASGGACPGSASGHWFRPAQRHRGLRHRRPLGKRYRLRGQQACVQLGLPAGHGCHRGWSYRGGNVGGLPVHQ